MDVVAVERAEAEIDKFVDAQATKRQGQDAANLAAIEERNRLARKIQAHREHNRTLWIEHYRKLTDNYIRLALEARRKARELALEAE